ncbi:MAG: ATP-binding protein [Reyranella sp.]|nr:ATP-binding protein [Reyranella sp.]
MTVQETTLHMLCGKIAAGKSTLARRLADAPATLLISEDYWLARLHGEEQRTVDDYIRNSRRLRDAMGGHVEALLGAGLSVVLDFPANTVASRRWMRGICDSAGVGHRLHFLDVPDDVCRARLQARNAAGTHEFAASDAEFEVITGYFQPPSPEEGFTVIVHRHAPRDHSGGQS